MLSVRSYQLSQLLFLPSSNLHLRSFHHGGLRQRFQPLRGDVLYDYFGALENIYPFTIDEPRYDRERSASPRDEPRADRDRARSRSPNGRSDDRYVFV